MCVREGDRCRDACATQPFEEQDDDSKDTWKAGVALDFEPTRLPGTGSVSPGYSTNSGLRPVGCLAYIW